MAEHCITLRIDPSAMFDMVRTSEDNGSALGTRLVSMLLSGGQMGFVEALGLAMYGVTVSVPLSNDRAVRDRRQSAILAWVQRAFGHVEGVDFSSIDERARRFLEEAVELYQATRPYVREGERAPSSAEARAHAHRIVDYVLDREPGRVHQEIGGVMVTLNALAEILGLSVADAEATEFARVLAKPIEHFQKRQEAKRDAGI